MVDSAREQQVVSAVPTGLFIGGQWRPAATGATFPVEDPSTGQVLTEVADATRADGLQALDAADARRSPAGPRSLPGSAARSSAGPTTSCWSARRTWRC